MANRSSCPCLRRRSEGAVPPGWLQYSSRSMASCTPHVPRLTAKSGSIPTDRHQCVNSPGPTSLVSISFQAVSSRTGRPPGPTPSSQR